MAGSTTELVTTLSMTCTLCTAASVCSFAICNCSCSTRAVCSARSSCSFFLAAAFLFLVCWCELADVCPRGCLPALPGLLGAALLLASCSSHKTSLVSIYGFNHSFIKHMSSPRARYVQPLVASCMRSCFGSQLTRVSCAQLMHGYNQVSQTGAVHNVQMIGQRCLFCSAAVGNVS